MKALKSCTTLLVLLLVMTASLPLGLFATRTRIFAMLAFGEEEGKLTAGTTSTLAT
jgi:hypothetical protein